jgi:hypothetical protein
MLKAIAPVRRSAPTKRYSRTSSIFPLECLFSCRRLPALVSSPFAAEHDRRWEAKLKNSIKKDLYEAPRRPLAAVELWLSCPKETFLIGLRVRVDSRRAATHISARNWCVQGFEGARTDMTHHANFSLRATSKSGSRHRKAFSVLHISEQGVLPPSAFCLHEGNRPVLHDGLDERDGRSRPSTVWSHEW